MVGFVGSGNFYLDKGFRQRGVMPAALSLAGLSVAGLLKTPPGTSDYHGGNTDEVRHGTVI